MDSNHLDIIMATASYFPSHCRDDLVSDAYIHFQTGKGKLEGKDPCKVIFNYFNNRYDNHYRGQAELVQLSFDPSDSEGNACNLDPSDLRDILDSIPQGLSNVLSLRLSGMSFVKISKKLGISVRACYYRFDRACELARKEFVNKRVSDEK